jgi:hypothetical protein
VPETSQRHLQSRHLISRHLAYRVVRVVDTTVKSHQPTKNLFVGSMRATSRTPAVSVVSDSACRGVKVSTAPWGCGAAGSAPRSQRGGQGFESPQLHRYRCSSKALSRSRKRAFVTSGTKVQQQSATTTLQDRQTWTLNRGRPPGRCRPARRLVATARHDRYIPRPVAGQWRGDLGWGAVLTRTDGPTPDRAARALG